MPSVQKTPSGYRIQIKLKGVRKSKTLPTKREALLWAAKEEEALTLAQSTSAGERTTLKALLDRYSLEVSPTRRGKRWEQLRLNAFCDPKLGLPLSMPVARLKPEHFASFRDLRQGQVKDGTVLRELGLLSAVMETARREWRLISGNPISDIRKPSAPKHRERLITRYEIREMLKGLGYVPHGPVKSISESIAICFLVALRTGMRAGELCGLTWANVQSRHAILPKTKNGQLRNVPLSLKAVKLIGRMEGFDSQLVFGLQTQTLDAIFRKIRERQGLEGFTWHDGRHTAATWLALSGKVSILELCAIFGWRDPKMAMRYFNPHPDSIAYKLD